jgi:phosphatidylglycerophosphate synthase
LLLAGLCDVLDGTIARMHNKSSTTGAYFDIISDRIVEMLFIIGLYVRQPENAFAYIFFLAALLLHFSTFISAGALIKNEGQKSLHHEYSYIERAEAFIVFSGILFLPQWCFILLCGLSGLMVLDASLRFMRIIKKLDIKA